eukprot:SAG31_NODE_8492_length_1441_cov_1.952310_2_plen_259_part_00
MVTYNEQQNVRATLDHLAKSTAVHSSTVVHVVDGGSKDGTVAAVEEVADDPSFKLELSLSNAKGGRGPCQRKGAEQASAKGADIILFLHADTELPAGYDALVRTALSTPGTLLTAFRFRVSRHKLPQGSWPNMAGLNWMEWTVNLRSTWYELPFGDQALAITASLLDELGGVPRLPIMEEFELVAKLRRRGAAGAGQIVTLPVPCECDGRRWATMAVWRANWTNQRCMIAYNFLGASANDIYRWYYGREPPLVEKNRR